MTSENETAPGKTEVEWTEEDSRRVRRRARRGRRLMRRHERASKIRTGLRIATGLGAAMLRGFATGSAQHPEVRDRARAAAGALDALSDLLDEHHAAADEAEQSEAMKHFVYEVPWDGAEFDADADAEVTP